MRSLLYAPVEELFGEGGGGRRGNRLQLPPEMIRSGSGKRKKNALSDTSVKPSTFPHL